MQNRMPIQKPRPNQYNRISQQNKRVLLNLIFRDRVPIKQAAGILGINYSTAKTVLYFYRKKLKEPVRAKEEAFEESDGQIAASYRNIEKHQSPKSDTSEVSSSKSIGVITSLGGSCQQTFRARAATVGIFEINVSKIIEIQY